MSTTHTPGPWILTENQKAEDSVFTGNYRLIEAGRGYFTDSVPGFCLSGYISRADALLIAAAPELLAALRAMVCMMDMSPKPEKLNAAITWRENDELARSMADKAIARAEGRQ